MTARSEDLLSFQKAHLFKTLRMERMEVIDGNWTSTLAAIRLCLPQIEDFLILGMIFDERGKKSARRHWDSGGFRPLEIERYIRTGEINRLNTDSGWEWLRNI